MNSISYDISKLEQTGKINTEGALKNYSDEQEYFDGLTEFTKKTGEYLNSFKDSLLQMKYHSHNRYNPALVQAKAGARKRLLAEIKELENILKALGMDVMAFELRYLGNAVLQNDMKALRKEFLRVAVNIKTLVKQITLAQLEKAYGGVSKKIILVVDDKPDILIETVAVLENSFSVIAAEGGADALKILDAHTPDLFLIDIEMSKMDGYELAGMIREREGLKDLPIVFFTANNSRDSVMEGIKYGGSDYILKSADKDLLLSRIRQCLE